MNYALCIAFTSSCGVDLDEDNGVKTMAAGYGHTVAIKNDGTLWAWGRNDYGQLGLGNSGAGTDRDTPVQVEINKANYPNAIDTDWVAVSAAFRHTVALKKDGSLWAWGENTSGQLGDGSTSRRTSPVRVLGTGTGLSWIAVTVTTSYYHTVALSENGELYAWGENTSGQLGLGSLADSQYNTPKKVGDATDWIAVVAGFYHTVALNAKGELWAWGGNDRGQLGLGPAADPQYNIPTRVGTDTDWRALFVGFYHTVALKDDGSLYAWGYNEYGQLGKGNNNNGPGYQDNYSPVQIGTDTDWASVSGGSSHTIAHKRNGTLWAWGENNKGQLGFGYAGFKLSNYTPQRLGEAADLVKVSAGQNHSIALRRSGILWIWGSNEYGQLGDNTVPTTGTENYRSKPGVVKWE